MIDGGKGQLGAAMAGMRAAGVDDVPVVSLAKKREEVFRPGRPDPLLLEEGSSALRVLQHIRDEAHRFALRHHRGRRARGMTQSVLDALPGVGPARKAAILRHFGSTERFLSASREELEAVPGVPSKVAREVYDHLHKTAGPREAPRRWRAASGRGTTGGADDHHRHERRREEPGDGRLRGRRLVLRSTTCRPGCCPPSPTWCCWRARASSAPRWRATCAAASGSRSSSRC